MIGDESIFSSIDKSIKSQVKLGNGELVETKGKGMKAQESKDARSSAPGREDELANIGLTNWDPDIRPVR
ncbi:hypothetical protein GBA52_012821 [Prunus armeniaca]|nr:hypothetical protein GBA52_012821 [Prunus armeniaca]